jgi:hypothetical protein
MAQRTQAVGSNVSRATARGEALAMWEWIIERDCQNWDRRVERDSAAGKLDFLREEVEAAKQKGTLREL